MTKKKTKIENKFVKNLTAKRLLKLKILLGLAVVIVAGVILLWPKISADNNYTLEEQGELFGETTSLDEPSAQKKSSSSEKEDQPTATQPTAQTPASTPQSTTTPQSAVNPSTTGTSTSSGLNCPRYNGIPESIWGAVNGQFTGTQKGLADVYCYVLMWIDYGLSIAGIVALIYMVFAGFTYAAAWGNDQAIEGAKKTVTWALIGLMLVIGAKTLVYIIENQPGLIK